MPVRSVLVGALVVLMGMLGGVLLSLVLSPPSPPPALFVQGVVAKAMPPVPVPPPSREPSEGNAGAAASNASKSEELGPETESASPPVASPLAEKIGTSEPFPPIFAPHPREETIEPLNPVAAQRQNTESQRPSRSPGAFAARGGSTSCFTLHVESFKDPRTAARRVEALRAQGLDAFTGPADIPGKGRFHRVFVGEFQDRASAIAYLEELKSEQKIGQGRVVARACGSTQGP